MPDDLSRYLAANPAMTPRDYKGKGFTEFAPFDRHYVSPGELPWNRLDPDEVRRLATNEKAPFLPRGVRMAAGRDPGLIFDERSRTYRLRADSAPPPSTANGAGGPKKLTNVVPSRPAAATVISANRVFRSGFAHAPARRLTKQGDLP